MFALAWEAGRSKSAGDTGETWLRRFACVADMGRRLDEDPPKRADESRNCCERRRVSVTSTGSGSARCSMASTTGSSFLAPSIEMLMGREREKFLDWDRE